MQQDPLLQTLCSLITASLEPCATYTLSLTAYTASADYATGTDDLGQSAYSAAATTTTVTVTSAGENGKALHGCVQTISFSLLAVPGAPTITSAAATGFGETDAKDLTGNEPYIEVTAEASSVAINCVDEFELSWENTVDSTDAGTTTFAISSTSGSTSETSM